MNFLEINTSPTIPMNEKIFSQNCTCGNERTMFNDEFEAMDVNVKAKTKKCSLDYSDVLKMHIRVQ